MDLYEEENFIENIMNPNGFCIVTLICNRINAKTNSSNRRKN